MAPLDPAVVFDQLAGKKEIRLFIEALAEQIERQGPIRKLLYEREYDRHRQSIQRQVAHLLDRFASDPRPPDEKIAELEETLIGLGKREADRHSEIAAELLAVNRQIAEGRADAGPFAPFRKDILTPERWPLPRVGSVVSADLVGSKKHIEFLSKRESGAHGFSKDLVRKVLKSACWEIGVPQLDHFEGGQGDDGTYVFRDVVKAVQYAEAIHTEAERENLGRSFESRLWFRVTVASGELYRRPRNDGSGELEWSGHALILATSIRDAGEPGAVFVCPQTHATLPANTPYKDAYAARTETVRWKDGTLVVHARSICPHHRAEADQAGRLRKPSDAPS